jgi:hypothetical protein
VARSWACTPTGLHERWGRELRRPIAAIIANSPAVRGTLSDQAFVAWKSMGADERLFYSSTADGRTSPGQRQITGTGGSSAGPALATSSTRL